MVSKEFSEMRHLSTVHTMTSQPSDSDVFTLSQSLILSGVAFSLSNIYRILSVTYPRIKKLRIIQLPTKCTLMKMLNCTLFTVTCFGHCSDHLQGVSSQEYN